MKFSEFKEQYQKLNEEERKEFIRNRVAELSSSSASGEIGLDVCGSYDGFIGPNLQLVSNPTPFFANMVLDDLNIYEEFMNYISNNLDHISTEPVTIVNIQNFIWWYFGYNASDKLGRIELYALAGSTPVSITELRGNEIAACSERSALVQNILKFLGFNSEILFGKINEEPHAYIAFSPEEHEDLKILYDPMNPVEYKYPNSDDKNYGIAVMLLSNDQYVSLKEGQPMNFYYNLVKGIYGEDKTYKELERTYYCDEYLYSKDNQK